ncbi:MAG TPA: HEAT repeat domain-containing protein [Ignavibacteriaceae bacterium]|nr:HEAT repeat domain-containing protein [Ignavibacteriaceae bacterium]
MKALILLSMLIIFPAATKAENPNLLGDKVKFTNKYAIDNLLACLASDIEGTRRQAVYYSGLYKVNESVDMLIKVVEKDKCEEIQKLAVYSLLQIESPKAIAFLKKYAMRGNSESVKRICKLVYSDFAHFK